MNGYFSRALSVFGDSQSSTLNAKILQNILGLPWF